MIEVSINYETFGFTEEQLEELNRLLLDAKIRNRQKNFETHDRQIQAVVTTRWKGDE